MVGTVFRELVHQVLEKIKNGSYFKWPNKIGGDPIKRNQSLLVNTTKSEDTPQKIAKLCGIIWNS